MDEHGKRESGCLELIADSQPIVCNSAGRGLPMASLLSTQLPPGSSPSAIAEPGGSEWLRLERNRQELRSRRPWSVDKSTGIAREVR